MLQQCTHCCHVSCRAATAVREGVCGADLLDAWLLRTRTGQVLEEVSAEPAEALAFNCCTNSVAGRWLVLVVLYCQVLSCSCCTVGVAGAG
jgi:hypothetical protein